MRRWPTCWPERCTTRWRALYGEEGLALERGWGIPAGDGCVGANLRGDGVSATTRDAIPTELATDVRVRQAVAHLIDRAALLEAITNSRGLSRDLYTHPHADYYEMIARAVPITYRYDQRRAQQLLEEAGFTRGSDACGAARAASGLPSNSGISRAPRTSASHIMVDSLSRGGIDATSHVFGVQRTSQETGPSRQDCSAGRSTSLDTTAPRSHDPRTVGREPTDLATPTPRWIGSSMDGIRRSIGHNASSTCSRWSGLR